MIDKGLRDETVHWFQEAIQLIKDRLLHQEGIDEWLKEIKKSSLNLLTAQKRKLSKSQNI